jgi:hypothetical protein
MFQVIALVPNNGTKQTRDQGDQTGRIFSYWAIVLLLGDCSHWAGFWKLQKEPKFWGYIFQLCINYNDKWVGLHFGLFFSTSSGHPETDLGAEEEFFLTKWWRSPWGPSTHGPSRALIFTKNSDSCWAIMRKTDTTYVVVTEHRCLCISFFRSWHWRSIYSNLTSQIPKCQRHLHMTS